MAPSSKEQWDLYDAKGDPLGRTAHRGDPLRKGEYHLVVQVWVRNSRGRYLIQKRSASLAVLPEMWATTAGSVLAGESACAGAVRELSEELGIRASEEELQVVLQERVSHSLGTAWLLERDVVDAEIRLQEEEVSEVMWASPATLRRMVSEGRFYDYGADYFDQVFGYAVPAVIRQGRSVCWGNFATSCGNLSFRGCFAPNARIGWRLSASSKRTSTYSNRIRSPMNTGRKEAGSGGTIFSGIHFPVRRTLTHKRAPG